MGDNELNHRFTIANSSTAVAIVLSITSLAHARADTRLPAPVCAVAVCDIPSELQKLRSDSQAQRFQEIVDLRNSYKNETQIAVLQNLLDFATQAGALFSQLKEEDWLVREAKNLANDALLKLSKFSQVDPSVLSGYYTQLTGEAARFEVITYWEGKIGDFEDQNQLLALGAFFKNAEAISTRAQDPELPCSRSPSKPGFDHSTNCRALSLLRRCVPNRGRLRRSRRREPGLRYTARESPRDHE